MIYFKLALCVVGIVAYIVCLYMLLNKIRVLELMCEKNMEFIARHAAEHVRMNEEQDEIAGRIADQIEKKWDTGLQKVLEWNPFMTKEDS